MTPLAVASATIVAHLTPGSGCHPHHHPACAYAVLAALVVALFDWIASLIEVPSRPIAVAIVGWVLAFLLLRGYLALPDLPGWFAAIGLLGAIPGFVCSWLTIKLDNKQSANA